MKVWNDDEVKNLFCLVEEQKTAKNALRVAFSLHAQKYKRKQNSVRNYYYKEVENLKNDPARCQKLQIDIKKHAKMHFLPFSEQQEEKLIEDVDALVKSGMSVRSACQKLGGGDLAVMTRLQNKYQNLKKKKLQKADNVIMFRQRQKLLSENDINSLFLGLVKLIKKTAVEEFSQKMKLEKESEAFLLKKAFVDLARKDKQITELKEEFASLKKENMRLVEKLEGLSLDKTKMLRSHLYEKHAEKLSEKLK